MTDTRKEYLGDSVYASFDGYHIILTTENGYPDDQRTPSELPRRPDAEGGVEGRSIAGGSALFEFGRIGRVSVPSMESPTRFRREHGPDTRPLWSTENSGESTICASSALRSISVKTETKTDRLEELLDDFQCHAVQFGKLLSAGGDNDQAFVSVGIRAKATRRALTEYVRELEDHILLHSGTTATAARIRRDRGEEIDDGN